MYEYAPFEPTHNLGLYTFWAHAKTTVTFGDNMWHLVAIFWRWVASYFVAPAPLAQPMSLEHYMYTYTYLPSEDVKQSFILDYFDAHVTGAKASNSAGSGCSSAPA